MPKVHGRHAFFSVTDAAAAVRILTPTLNTIDFPRQAGALDATSFGEADKTYIPGTRDATIRSSGFWDAASNGLDEVCVGLLGGGADGTISSAFVYGPNGSVAGKIKYSGTCILTSYQASSPVGGVVTASADWQCSGSITRGTF